MSTPGDRAIAKAAWWMNELERHMRDYITNPAPSKRDALLQQMDQYAAAVEEGAFKPIRMTYY